MSEENNEYKFLSEDQLSGEATIECLANEDKVVGSVWLGALVIDAEEGRAFVEAGIEAESGESFFVVTASVPVNADGLLEEDETECEVEVTTPEIFFMIVDGENNEAATDELTSFMVDLAVDELGWSLGDDDEEEGDE